MKLVNEKDVPFKYTTYGPKYLFNESGFSGGVAHIIPGEEIKEHVHDVESEIFYFVKGEPLFITDGKQQRVKAGDGFTIFPGEKHCVKNDTKETITFVFLKTKGA